MTTTENTFGGRLLIDENHSLFNKDGMIYKEYSSDFRLIRYITLQIIQKAPDFIREINLLEQQISEIIKNAMKHGNKMDPDKKIRVWYLFNETRARLIVSDEGEGFQKIEEWNEFNDKRQKLFEQKDFENMAEYVSFRSDQSDDFDGGNSLFAAVEFWNAGVVYDTKRTSVAVGKYYKFQDRIADLNYL
jgi:hypothetical protein